MQGQISFEPHWSFCLDALSADEKKREALLFLLRNMPGADRAEKMTVLVLEAIDQAFEARNRFPWCRDLSDATFLNYVLPYCVFDEERDENGRQMLSVLAESIVASCNTISEAVMRINKQIFSLLNVCDSLFWFLYFVYLFFEKKVVYSTQRRLSRKTKESQSFVMGVNHGSFANRAPNQNVSESCKLGLASCTGLSIILVMALRSVGIPARGCGTALWSKGSGNHTWVEFMDEKGEWHFVGASEQDDSGHDRAWFVPEAAKAVPNSIFAIYATSFEKRNHHCEIYFVFVILFFLNHSFSSSCLGSIESICVCRRCHWTICQGASCQDF